MSNQPDIVNSPPTPHAQEHVVIAGAGMSGCMAALFAAKRGFKVTLIDKKDLILNGASMVAARKHLGGEYPEDLPTGKDCLRGAMVWQLVMPKGTETDQPPMKFTITKDELEHGTLTLDGYQHYYEKIRLEYADLFEQIRAEKGWTQEQAEQELFGSPDMGKFYRPLTEEELEPYGGFVGGGIQSQERGLNIPLYLSNVEDMLKKAGVEIITGREIESYTPQNGKTLLTWNEPSKETGLNTPRMVEHSMEADYVIQCAAEGGPKLDMPHRSPEQLKDYGVNVYYRAMGVFDTTGSRNKIPGPTFAMGLNGCMWSALNGNTGLVYSTWEATSRIGQMKLNQVNQSLVPEWEHSQKLGGTEDWSDRGTEIKRHVVDNGPYKFLDDCTVGMMVGRYTLNFQDSLEQRRHEPTMELKPGLVVTNPTKVGNTPMGGIEAVEMIYQRSQMRAKHIPDTVPITQTPDALKLALSGIYDLAADAPALSYDRAVEFAEERNLPPTMARAQPGEKYYFEASTHEAAEGGAGKIATRPFGQGFGKSDVVVYKNGGPKTGPLLSNEDCAAIDAWKNNIHDRRVLTDVVDTSHLDNAVRNQLIHSDTLTLIRLMPGILTNLSTESKAHLFDESAIKHIPHSMWKTIAKNRPGAKLPAKFKADDLEFYFYQLLSPNSNVVNEVSNKLETTNDKHLRARTLVPKDLKDSGVKQTESALAESNGLEIMSVVFPLLFEALNDNQRAGVIEDIAKALQASGKDKLFFSGLSNPDHNRIIVSHAPMKAANVFNTGRTFQVNYQDPSSLTFMPSKIKSTVIRFQGNDYYPVQFHAHRNRDVGVVGATTPIKDENGQFDGKLEFRLYDSPAHQEQCQKHLVDDPNDAVMGELHTVFMYKDAATGHNRALVLCAHLVIGAENKQFGHYLDEARKHVENLEEKANPKRPRSLPKGKKFATSDLAFDPLGCYQGQTFAKDGLPECSFRSFNLGKSKIQRGSGHVGLESGSSHVFYGGVHGVHHDKPVTMSLDQFKQLQELQERLAVLNPDVHVEPLMASLGKSLGGHRR